MGKSIWKENPRQETDSILFEVNDGPPRVVLLAIGLLLVIFGAGSLYLFSERRATGVEIAAPADLPEVSVVITAYQGPILGLEKKRDQVEKSLELLGITSLMPITIYPQTPLRMKPIEVSCKVGYILPLGRQLKDLDPGLVQETIRPGRRLVVRIKGKGNLSGNKAYHAAIRFLRPMGMAPDEGERYEVKVNREGRLGVEHWIPVR